MQTKTLQQVIRRLNELRTSPNTEVVLIVNGIAYPIVDIWWHPKQGDNGAICIGDDPR